MDKTNESLRALAELVDAVAREFCSTITESLEEDDSKVAFPEEKCHITFGHIRRARKALESLLNQAPAVGQAAEGWVLVPREALLTEAKRLRYRAAETFPSFSETTDAGAQMVATASKLEELSAAPAAPPIYYGKQDGSIGAYRGPAAPAVEVDEAMVERALAVMFPSKYDEHLRKNWHNTTRDALAAALGLEVGE